MDTTPKKWGIGVSFYDEVEVSETKIVPQMIFKIKPFSGSTVKISITKECPGEFDEKFIAEQFDSVLAAVKMINFPLIEHLDFAGCIIEIDYEIIGEDNPIKVSASVESKMVEDIVASESLPEDIFLGVSNDKSYRLISASIIDIQSNLNNEAQGKLMISVSNDNISRTLKYLKANLGQPE